MARKRAPERDKALYMYVKAAGNIKLVDIAKELKVSDNQIRQWKKKDDWDNMTIDDIDMVDGKIVIKSVTNKKDNVTIKNNVTNGIITKDNESVINKSNEEKEREVSPTIGMIKNVTNNSKLTEEQKLYCYYYVKYRNKTKAYMMARGCTRKEAYSHAYRWSSKVEIQEEIERILSNIRDNIQFSIEDLIQKNIDIALSDIGDYMTFGRRKKKLFNDAGDPIPDPETGEQKVVEYNYVDLKDSKDLDTDLIGKIKQGKDGISMELLDKQKAMDFLYKHLSLLDKNTKEKLNIENKRLQNIKLQTEIDKIKGDKSDKPIKIVFGKASELQANE